MKFRCSAAGSWRHGKRTGSAERRCILIRRFTDKGRGGNRCMKIAIGNSRIGKKWKKKDFPGQISRALCAPPSERLKQYRRFAN